LGLAGTSAASIGSVRSHADKLGADASHFVGQRLWAGDGFRAAVATSETWDEVATKLIVEEPPDTGVIRGHARRMSLDTAHLDSEIEDPAAGSVPMPDLANLSRAGPLLAATWYTLCGHNVSWPLEPSRYDLLVVDRQQGKPCKVQVKTTTVRAGGSWKVYLSTSGRRRQVYCPGEIDEFFVIDGDLTCYVIPIAAVGGLFAVHLGAYDLYRVESSIFGGRSDR